ncbi:hypothetical protein [Castellaniella denitrificans]|uniref:hypothetical protein n=1 Tax=Castellaniella denitrificans TaxID=56119 RepID=UPI003612F98D
MKIEDGKLVVDIDGSTMQVPLPAVAGTSRVKAWQVPEAYRAGRLFVSVIQPGQVEEVPACAPGSAQYLGELTLEPADDAALRAAKASKLAEINAACDLAGKAVLAGYPDVEIKTWPQQAAEAAAYQADSQAEVPLLTKIAADRGLTVADLATRVQAKEAAFKAAAGGLLGMRQALEDQIDAAAGVEDLAGIVFDAASALA